VEVELVLNGNREIKLLLLLSFIFFFSLRLSSSGFRIGFALGRRGLLSSFGRCSTRRGLGRVGSGSFIVDFLPLRVNLDISESVNVVLVDFDALVSETVPADESAFFDNVSSLFTLVDVVHKLGKVS